MRKHFLMKFRCIYNGVVSSVSVLFVFPFGRKIQGNI